MKIVYKGMRFRTNCSKSIIFLILIVQSCLSPITIKTNKAGGSIVISGQISTLSDRNYVQIGITSSEERLPSPVSNARIILYDDKGNEYYFNEFNIPGVYELRNFSGMQGINYHIQVTLATGEVYESTPEVIPESAGNFTTSTAIERDEFTGSDGKPSTQDFVKIFNTSSLSESLKHTYLRWSVEEAFIISPTDYPDINGSIPPPCFVVQPIDPQRISLFVSAPSSGIIITNQLIGARIIDYSFLEKHYFTTYQTSLTADAYEYWQKVNILANQVGSIFDAPPAKIRGNIVNVNNDSEEVLGYFQAVNESYERVVLFPSDINVPIEFKKCDFNGNFDPLTYPSRCFDCLRVSNSSYTRPDWF